MTMITPSYLGETIEYSSLHACRSTLEDPTCVRFSEKNTLKPVVRWSPLAETMIQRLEYVSAQPVDATLSNQLIHKMLTPEEWICLADVAKPSQGEVPAGLTLARRFLDFVFNEMWV